MWNYLKLIYKKWSFKLALFIGWHLQFLLNLLVLLCSFSLSLFMTINVASAGPIISTMSVDDATALSRELAMLQDHIKRTFYNKELLLNGLSA